MCIYSDPSFLLLFGVFIFNMEFIRAFSNLGLNMSDIGQNTESKLGAVYL